MSQEASSEYPGYSSDGSSGTVRAARLDVAGHDRAQQASLGLGTQHNYFAAAPTEAEISVSIAPPAGQRDERFPLRGRNSFLSELLAAGDGPRVRVLHGMGGCGKTSLALEAAHLASQRGAQVWWLSATEERRLLAGMRALSRRLGASDDELQYGDAADWLWHRLRGWEQEWLLVIDNADDPQILAAPGMCTADGTGWLRPLEGRTGLILVTSRDGRAATWGSWCKLHLVEMLATDEAVRVLADRAGAHHDLLGGNTDAAALAERLGRLPLALRIAGSFLAELADIPPVFAGPAQIRSYRQYQLALEQGYLHTVFPSPETSALTPSLARDILDRTWELTLDQLESRQLPEARRLLRLLACFADAPIPHELLLHPHAMADSELFANITGPRLWQILQTLAGFGLIDLTAGSNRPTARVIRLHPLVRDTSGPRGSQSERAAYLVLAASLLRRAASAEETGSPEDPAAWPRWQVLAPHAVHVFESVTVTTSYPDNTITAAAYAADKAASYQANQGLTIPAEATHRAVLQVRLRALGADHPDTIDTWHSVARRLSERADYDHAETEYRSVLEASRKILGPDHPETLTVQHNLASLVSFRGDYSQAEAAYREVLAIKMRVFGPDHEYTHITRHEVARMMSVRGSYAEAEAELRRVLAARLRNLGPNHYNTLVTRYQIARTMAAQGRHLGAETEFRDILTSQLELLGAEHVRTLWTRRQIALTMAAQGDYSEAENILRDVLARRRQRFPYHPDTLATWHELAQTIAAQGDTTRACTEFQDLLAAQIRTLGTEHPSTVMTRHEIETLPIF